MRQVVLQCKHLLFTTMKHVLRQEDERMKRLNWNDEQKYNSVAKLLQSFQFHRSLLACSTESVLVASNLSHFVFPKSLHYFNITPLHMFRVIETFVKAHGDMLPLRLKQHLRWCDERILCEDAWKQGEDIFIILRDHKLSLLARFTEKTRGGATAMNVKNVTNVTKVTTKMGAITPLPTTPRPTTTPPLPSLCSVFLRKLERLSTYRLSLLFDALNMSRDRIFMDSVWTILLNVFSVRWWLLQNRTLNQMILCSIYMVGKTLQKKELTFALIVNKFVNIAKFVRFPAAEDESLMGARYMYEAANEMMFNVPMTLYMSAEESAMQSKATSPPLSDHLFVFYNTIFLEAMHKYAFDLSEESLIVFPGVDEKQVPTPTKKKNVADKEKKWWWW